MIFKTIVVVLLVMILFCIGGVISSIDKVIEHLRIHDIITLDENDQKRMGNLYKELHK